jgi:hypothetical protein
MLVRGDKKSLFGEHMNGITVLLRTKYKNAKVNVQGVFTNGERMNEITIYLHIKGGKKKKKRCRLCSI